METQVTIKNGKPANRSYAKYSTPFIPFTEEQKQTANNVELAEFLRMRGEKLERAGREYKLIYIDGGGKHDSI